MVWLLRMVWMNIYIHGLVAKDGLSELKYICIHGLVAKDSLDEYICMDWLLRMD